MKHLVHKIGPLLLAFLLGVVAKTVWDNRQLIQEVFSNLSFTIKIELGFATGVQRQRAEQSHIPRRLVHFHKATISHQGGQ